MPTFKFTTSIFGAPANHELAQEIFEEAGNPIANQAKGMSRYRLTDGSHIVCTFRAIWHTTRKASSPLVELGAKRIVMQYKPGEAGANLAAQRSTATHKCIICGDEFEARVAKVAAKYCSNRCRQRAKYQRQKEAIQAV